MINITKIQFNEKKKQNRVFSLITEYRGDEVTPIRIFNGFKGKRRFILLPVVGSSIQQSCIRRK